MILVNTQDVAGHRIAEYLGLTTGNAIVGVNFVADAFGSLTEVFGGRSSAYEKALRSAQEAALRDAVDAAQGRGANALIGLTLSQEAVGMKNGNSMLSVTWTGTAVRIVPA